MLNPYCLLCLVWHSYHRSMSYFVETDVFDKLRQQNEGRGVNGYLNNGKNCKNGTTLHHSQVQFCQISTTLQWVSRRPRQRIHRTWVWCFPAVPESFGQAKFCWIKCMIIKCYKRIKSKRRPSCLNWRGGGKWGNLRNGWKYALSSWDLIPKVHLAWISAFGDVIKVGFQQ